MNVSQCGYTTATFGLPKCPPVPGVPDPSNPCGGADVTGTLLMNNSEPQWPFLMSAYDGPVGNSRITTTFSGNDFEIRNILPSDYFAPDLPSKNYFFQGTLGLGTYQNYEYFQTPSSMSINYQINAVGCETNDTGLRFVMCPGHVQGTISLSGPVYTGNLPRSPWANMTWAQNFPYPAGGPPINNPQLDQASTCYVQAKETSGGGAAKVLFNKDAISPDGSTFDGHYDLRLAGLSTSFGAPLITHWNPNNLHLNFSYPTGTAPADDIEESLDITDGAYANILIFCGQHHTNNINYCFGEVLLNVVDSNIGDTSYQSVSVTGSSTLPGGQTASFSATGTPVTSSSGQVTVPIRLFLPEGVYQNVNTTVFTKGGGSYTLPTTTFSSICGVIQTNVPGAPIFTLEGLDKCYSSNNASLTIDVFTPNIFNGSDPYQITYKLNGDPVVNGCGFNNTSCPNPVTINNLSLQLGKNVITVTVKDITTGLSQTASKTLYYEPTPISVSCNDILIQMPALQNSVQVDYNTKGNVSVSSAINPITVTYDPPNFSSFPVGTTPVTCSVADDCSSNFCTFNVIVSQPPCIVITNGYFTCNSNVPGGYTYHFTVINNQTSPISYVYASSISANCLSIGINSFYYYFPTPLLSGIDNAQSGYIDTMVNPGCVQQQLCIYLTAYNTQNVFSCSVQDCFNNPALPTISCPSDIITDCTNDTGATVGYTLPSATSVCCSPVTVTANPPPGTFPIGVTPVKVTALDSCGHSNTCSFTVTVRGHSSNMDSHRNLRHDGVYTDYQFSDAIAVDAKGFVYITGYFKGNAQFGQFSLTSRGGADVFLAKFNSDLTGPIWVQTAGGPGDDAANAVAVDSLGNCYITGTMDNSPNYFQGFSLPNSPVDPNISFHLETTISTISDMFLAKYDPQGNLLWVASGGGNGEPGDNAEGLAIDANDVPYVCGSYHSAVTWYSANSGLVTTTTLNGNGTTDAYIIKYDPSGTPGWATSSGPSSPSASYFADARGLAIDNHDILHPAIDIVGMFGDTPSFGSHPIGPTGLGYGHAFVAQCAIPTTGASPVWNWAQEVNNPQANLASIHDGRQIGVDSAGNCYFTAYYVGRAEIGNNPQIIPPIAPSSANPYFDYMVGSFSSMGAPRWLKSGGGSGDDETRALAVRQDIPGSESDGDVYLTGFQKGVDTHVDGGSNIMLLHYEGANGKKEPLATQHFAYGSLMAAQNAGRGVAIDKAGCVYWTGTYTDNHLNFVDFANAQNSPVYLLGSLDGNPNTFIAKYCPQCAECVPPTLSGPPSLVAVVTFDPTSYPVSFTACMTGSAPMKIFWTHGTWNLGTYSLNPTGGDVDVPGHYKIVNDPTGLCSTLTLYRDLDSDCPTCDNFPYSVYVTNACGAYGGGIAQYDIAHFGVDPTYNGVGNIPLRLNLPLSQPFTIQYRDSLKPTNSWHVLTNGIGTGGLSHIYDPTPNPTNRFYRIRIP